MTMQWLDGLDGALGVMIAIGTVGGFAMWIKLSMLSMEKSQAALTTRVDLLEKQFDVMIAREQDMRVDIADKLGRIETMLSTRPCVIGRETRHRDDCDA